MVLWLRFGVSTLAPAGPSGPCITRTTALRGEACACVSVGVRGFERDALPWGLSVAEGGASLPLWDSRPARRAGRVGAGERSCFGVPLGLCFFLSSSLTL